MVGLFVLCVVSFGAFALTGTSSSPASDDLEATAKRLEEALRCPVCEGQSVAESNSAVAFEIRADIRRRLTEGEQPSEILDHYVEQYGTWILNRPPYEGAFILFWIAPFAALGAGAVIAIRYVRRGPKHRERPKGRDGHHNGRDGNPSPADEPYLSGEASERLARELKNRL